MNSILEKLKKESCGLEVNAIEFLYDNCSYRLIAYLDKHLPDIKREDWYKFLFSYTCQVEMEIETIEYESDALMNRLARYKDGWVKMEPKIIAQQNKWDKINKRK